MGPFMKITEDMASVLPGCLSLPCRTRSRLCTHRLLLPQSLCWRPSPDHGATLGHGDGSWTLHLPGWDGSEASATLLSEGPGGMVPLSMQSPAHQCTLDSPPSPLPSLPPHNASWDHFPDKLLAPKSSPRGLKIENRCTEGSFKDTALPGCQAQSQGKGLSHSREMSPFRAWPRHLRVHFGQGEGQGSRLRRVTVGLTKGVL